jgi:hypothetical protein
VDLGWLVFIGFGVVFFLAARPLATATVNAYDRYGSYSPEKKARVISVQTIANRIGAIVAIALGTIGLFRSNFLR